MMKRAIATSTLVALLATFGWAAEDRAKVVGRADAAQKVLQEVMGAPDKGIPEEIASGAECLAVIPSLMKGGFVFGASYGKGAATCRRATITGAQSHPYASRAEAGACR